MHCLQILPHSVQCISLWCSADGVKQWLWCGVCQRQRISHCLFGCLDPAVNIHNHAAKVKIGDKSLHQPTYSHIKAAGGNAHSQHGADNCCYTYISLYIELSRPKSNLCYMCIFQIAYKLFPSHSSHSNV